MRSHERKLYLYHQIYHNESISIQELAGFVAVVSIITDRQMFIKTRAD